MDGPFVNPVRPADGIGERTMILPRGIRLPFVVSVCALLAGCVDQRVIEVRAFSPQLGNCTIDRYRQSIENYVKDIPMGTSTDGYRRVYGPIAAEILSMPPISVDHCEIQHTVARLQDDNYRIIINIIEEQGRVCIEHSLGFDTSGWVNRACLDRQTHEQSNTRSE